MARPRRARERRRLVDPDHARARLRRPLRPRRSSSTGGSRPRTSRATTCWRCATERSGRSTSGPSSATSWSARRPAARRTRAHALQVARARRRGSRRRPVRRRARPGDAALAREVASLIPLEQIRAARELIAGTAIRTPLVRLNAPEAPAEIYLKLENLQPIGSFKLRGAYNAVRNASARSSRTASAPRAQGTWPRDWPGRRARWACRARSSCPTTRRRRSWRRSPASAARSSGSRSNAGGRRSSSTLRGRRRLLRPPGRRTTRHGRERHDRPRDPRGPARRGRRDDPLGRRRPHDRHCQRHQGTRPRCRHLHRASPRPARRSTATLAAGSPQEVDYQPSFVDGSGARALLPRMWALAEPLLDGAYPVTLDDTAAAVRLIAERARVIAEGAGALATAVALSGRAGAARSSASSRAGTSTSRCLRRSSAARHRAARTSAAPCGLAVLDSIHRSRAADPTPHS